jgi:hypothetical protein
VRYQAALRPDIYSFDSKKLLLAEQVAPFAYARLLIKEPLRSEAVACAERANPETLRRLNPHRRCRRFLPLT